MAGKYIDQLVDVALVRLQLTENKSKSGNTIVRGEFASYNTPTANKRFYPESVWKKEIKRLNEAMADRRVFGELDHPESGRTSLKHVSHIVTGMGLKNGVLIGEAEILPTTEGKQLETLLKSGCKVGVSSRGHGSVKPNDEGVDVVQEDYKLVTFDFVADPAHSQAYPTPVFEGVEFPMSNKLDENSREDADIRGHADEDAAKAAEWAKKMENGEFAATEDALPKDLLNKLAEMRAEVEEQVRGEMLSDPKVAGALTALEGIKDLLRPFVLPTDAKAVAEQKDSRIAVLENEIASKDLEISELKEERDKLAAVAKESAYKYYLERTLAEDPDAELVRNLIGDVKTFESSAALKARLEAVREELSIKRDQDNAKAEALKAEAAKTEALVRQVKEKADEDRNKLEEAVRKLAKTNKELALRLYKQTKLQGDPNSAKIRSMLEHTGIQTKEDVDSVFEEFAPVKPHDMDEAADVRTRVRKTLKSNTFEADALAEEFRSENSGPQLFGVDMSELQSLSGIAGRGR